MKNPKIRVKEGDKFNMLTAIKEVDRISSSRRRFLWECDCGKRKELNTDCVKNSGTKSCGCLKKTCQKKGEKSPCWKGGKYEHEGYIRVYVPSHPHATTNGYAYEHIVVMCERLGRDLRSHENVHHINGNKKDNRVENLELWSTYQPSGQRIKNKLQWAYEIIEMYKDEK